MQKPSKKQDAPLSRPFGATENDAQNLHALRLLPMIVVRNPAHEVFCLEKACLDTVKAGTMTGDLASLCGREGVNSLTFLKAVRARLEENYA